MTARNAFFDPSRARGPRRGPDVGPRDAANDNGEAPLTVSALIGQIKDALAAAFPKRVTVVGELSNVKLHTSGHLYFRLKDARTAIDAAMFRGRASKLRFTPEDGMEVVVEGKVDVYDVRGQLQLYVERITPKGAGELELAFRQLREKLEREGLFAPERKKPIPRFPRALGVVTSATGAAVRDIRRTLGRRWPGASVYLVPTLVQGEGAAEGIAESVRLLDAAAGGREIDTILVARGGGSIEDLWAFNEEVVARAIAAAATPVISGVGHEVDVTICDLVADARAATPTAAAELAVPSAEEVREQVAGLAGRLTRALGERLRHGRAALDAFRRSVVFRDPSWRVRTAVQRVDELSRRLASAMGERIAQSRRRLEPPGARLAALHPARLAGLGRRRLDALTRTLAWALGGRSKQAGDALSEVASRLAENHPRHGLRLARQRLRAAGRQLESLSYRRVLERGFSVTRDADGAIIRSSGEPADGERIETEFADGRVGSRVDRRASGEAPPRPPAPKRARRKPRDTGGPTLFDTD